MNDTFDVAVVGGGVMGSATAWALTKRGVKTVLLERFEAGHARGSSHGLARIFRLSYPDQEYVRMAQAARPLWDELATEVGEEILIPCGGIDAGDSVMDNHAALTACGVEAHLLEPEVVFDRLPWLNPPEGGPLLFSPDGAVIRADVVWRGLLDQAGSGGADVRQNARVTDIRTDGSKAVVATEAGDVEASVVVVTAGAWSRRLLEPLGITLDVKETRETVAYFETPVTDMFTYVEWGNHSMYALASPEGVIKVGEHIAGPQADPDDEHAEPDRESLMRLMDWVAHRFPQAAHAPDRAETCFYTNTPDEGFILERHGNIVVGSACSGHGFKFAPLIGERLADLAQEVS